LTIPVYELTEEQRQFVHAYLCYLKSRKNVIVSHNKDGKWHVFFKTVKSLQIHVPNLIINEVDWTCNIKPISFKKVQMYLQELSRFLYSSLPIETILDMLSDRPMVPIRKPYNEYYSREIYMLQNVCSLEPKFLFTILNELGVDYKVEKDRVRFSITNDGCYGYIFLKPNECMYLDLQTGRVDYAIQGLYWLYRSEMETLFDKLFQFQSTNISNIELELPKLRPTIVDSVEEIGDKLLDGKVLLIAQTGSGKTRTIKQLAKQGKKILLLVPLAVQVLQEEKSYLSNPTNYPKSAFFCQGSKCRDLLDTTFIVATYNQLENIRKRVDLSDWYVVIDEAHNLITSLTYRKPVLTHLWRFLERRDQYLLMTATPHFLYLERFVDKVYKVRVKPKKNRYFTIVSCSNWLSCCQTALDNIRNLTKYPYKQFLYIDSKQTLYALKNLLKVKCNGLVDIEVSTSEKRDSAHCIIDRKQTDYDVLLATRVLSEGFHIIQEGKFIYHVIPSDINVMVQKINRVREYNEKGEELDNWVFVILYVPDKVKSNVNYTKEWRERFEVYHRIISCLFDLSSTDVDPVLFIPLVHASTYRDINEQLLVCSSKFVKSIVESEGFTYIGNTDLQTFDFYMNFELLSLLKQTNERLHEVVKTIRQYPELFDYKTLQKYRQRIREGKFSSVRKGVRRKVNRKSKPM